MIGNYTPQTGDLILLLDSWADLDRYPDKPFYRSAWGTPVVVLSEADEGSASALRYPTGPLATLAAIRPDQDGR